MAASDPPERLVTERASKLERAWLEQDSKMERAWLGQDSKTERAWFGQDSKTERAWFGQDSKMARTWLGQDSKLERAWLEKVLKLERAWHDPALKLERAWLEPTEKVASANPRPDRMGSASPSAPSGTLIYPRLAVLLWKVPRRRSRQLRSCWRNSRWRRPRWTLRLRRPCWKELRIFSHTANPPSAPKERIADYLEELSTRDLHRGRGQEWVGLGKPGSRSWRGPGLGKLGCWNQNRKSRGSGKLWSR
nr:uncharacterized protein LOC133570092 [Nerophis lumbriciformis]